MAFYGLVILTIYLDKRSDITPPHTFSYINNELSKKSKILFSLGFVCLLLGVWSTILFSAYTFYDMKGNVYDNMNNIPYYTQNGDKYTYDDYSNCFINKNDVLINSSNAFVDEQ